VEGGEVLAGMGWDGRSWFGVIGKAKWVREGSYVDVVMGMNVERNHGIAAIEEGSRRIWKDLRNREITSIGR